MLHKCNKTAYTKRSVFWIWDKDLISNICVSAPYTPFFLQGEEDWYVKGCKKVVIGVSFKKKPSTLHNANANWHNDITIDSPWTYAEKKSMKPLAKNIIGWYLGKVVIEVNLTLIWCVFWLIVFCSSSLASCVLRRLCTALLAKCLNIETTYLGANIHLWPSYMHIKHLVILTFIF